MIMVSYHPVLPYIASHLIDHLPILHAVWSTALTEWCLSVAILSVQAATEGMGFNRGCPDGDFHHSGLVPGCRIFRIPPTVIYGIRSMGSATIIVGCRHPPSVLDAILIAIEEHPWREKQNWEVFNPVDLIVPHPRDVYHPEGGRL